MFLRFTKTPDDSLITLEYKDGAILQAKGSYNRKPSEEEMKFLESYCNTKQIKLKI